MSSTIVVSIFLGIIFSGFLVAMVILVKKARHIQSASVQLPIKNRTKTTDKKYWKVVKGEITESRLEYRDKKRMLGKNIRSYRAHFSYKYNAYGKEYKHNSLLQAWTINKKDAVKHVKKFPVGSKVIVRFDPDFPENSLMEVSSN